MVCGPREPYVTRYDHRMVRTWGWLFGFALVACGDSPAGETETDGETDTDGTTSGTNPTGTMPATSNSGPTSDASTTSLETSGTMTAADESSSTGPSSFTVSGTVSGLNGSITLHNNDGDELTMDADGAFTFETPLEAGETYAVTAPEIPGVQLCVIDRADGSADDNVSDVLVRCGNKALFSARTADEGIEPWITDGTDEGTFMLADVNEGPGLSNPVFIAGVGGRLIFSARTNPTGSELWSTDGTVEGTVMLEEIVAGPVESGASLAGVFDGLLYLHVRGALWVTDGQPGGVMEEFFDPEPSTQGSASGGVAAGGFLVFEAQLSGDREPWVTDGTEDGTMPLGDLNALGSSSPEFFGRAFDGQVYFTALTEDGRELWVTDGTPEGTTQVFDAQPGPVGSDPEISGWLGDRVLFSANVPKLLAEPFISDGTRGGTVSLGDLNPLGNSDALGFTSLGELAVFSATDGTTGRELWVTDGSPEGTELVLDIDEGPAGGLSSGIVNRAANPSPDEEPWVVFQGNNGTDGNELWVTDGTAEGTMMLVDRWPGAAGSSPVSFQPVGPELLLFSASTSEEGCEPHITDGTAAGTIALAPVFPGPGDGCG